jgi:hypothetical protein
MAMKMPKTSEMMASLESGVDAMLRFLNKFWTKWKGEIYCQVLEDSLCLMKKRIHVNSIWKRMDFISR